MLARSERGVSNERGGSRSLEGDAFLPLPQTRGPQSRRRWGPEDTSELSRQAKPPLSRPWTPQSACPRPEAGEHAASLQTGWLWSASWWKSSGKTASRDSGCLWEPQKAGLPRSISCARGQHRSVGAGVGSASWRPAYRLNIQSPEMIGPTTESDVELPSQGYINVLRKIESAKKKEREFSLRERGGDRYSDGIRLLRTTSKLVILRLLLRFLLRFHQFRFSGSVENRLCKYTVHRYV